MAKNTTWYVPEKARLEFKQLGLATGESELQVFQSILDLGLFAYYELHGLQFDDSEIDHNG